MNQYKGLLQIANSQIEAAAKKREEIVKESKTAKDPAGYIRANNAKLEADTRAAIAKLNDDRKIFIIREKIAAQGSIDDMAKTLKHNRTDGGRAYYLQLALPISQAGDVAAGRATYERLYSSMPDDEKESYRHILDHQLTELYHRLEPARLPEAEEFISSKMSADERERREALATQSELFIFEETARGLIEEESDRAVRGDAPTLHDWPAAVNRAIENAQRQRHGYSPSEEAQAAVKKVQNQ